MKIVIVSTEILAFGRVSERASELRSSGIHIFEEPFPPTLHVARTPGKLHLRVVSKRFKRKPYGTVDLGQGEECLVLVHSTCAGIRNGAIPHQFLPKWSPGQVTTYAFSHDTGSHIFVALEEGLEKDPVSVTELRKALKEAIRKGDEELRKGEVIPKLSGLKHGISNLLSAIDTDLQELIERTGDQRAAFLREIIRDGKKKKGYCAQQLEKVQGKIICDCDESKCDSIKCLVGEYLTNSDVEEAYNSVVEIANHQQVASCFELLDQLLPEKGSAAGPSVDTCDRVADVGRLEWGEAGSFHGWLEALLDAISSLERELLQRLKP